jgi:carboxyl-terminal processing protease
MRCTLRLTSVVLVILVVRGGVRVTATAPQSAAAPATTAASAPLATFDAAWNTIRETFVDDGRSEAEWEALRRELRPRAAQAADAESVRVVIRDLLARIGRSHFDLLPADVRARISAATSPDRMGTAGMDLTPIDGRLVVARIDPLGPAAGAGLRPGDVLEAVDDQDLKGVVAASGFRLWALAQALLRGETDTPVRLTIRDAGDQVSTVVVRRKTERGQPVTLGYLPTFFARLDQRWIEAGAGSRVALLRWNVWMVPLAGAIDRAVDQSRQADGIVIDLRGNPGGVLSMLMGISGHFLDSPVSLGTLRTRDTSLNLVANPRTVAPDGRRVTPYHGRLAILVDETSYSASEIFAAGMQAVGRARIFGQQTPGGALPAMLRELPNGDVLEYAIGDFVTATGERVEGRGVIPDQPVVPTRASLAAGSDLVLDAAVRWAGARGPEKGH